MEGRLNYISLLRVLAMFLIVIFHSLCFYTGVWWKFTTDVIEVWKIISDLLLILAWLYLSLLLDFCMVICILKKKNIKSLLFLFSVKFAVYLFLIYFGE